MERATRWAMEDQRGKTQSLALAAKLQRRAAAAEQVPRQK